MRDLRYFESCSASVSSRSSLSNCSPHRALDSDEALLVEHEREATLDLHLAHHVVLGGVERDVRADLVDDLVDDRAGRLQALLLDPLPDRVAVGGFELGRQGRVDPLRLADLRPQVVDHVADALDLGVSELEREQHRLLGDLVGAGLDHRQRVARADDDQVEIRVLVGLLERRVDDELAVDPGDANGAHRAEERQRRDRERGGRAVDAEDVVPVDHVRGEDGADHLHLVPEALRPERPDRAVDHARGEGRPLGRLPFALEEAARDLPGGVHLLLDVDGQREEVRVGAGLLPADGRREDHRVAGADDDCAVGLLGELAGLERDLATTDLDRHRGLTPGCDAHMCVPFTLL